MQQPNFDIGTPPVPVMFEDNGHLRPATPEEVYGVLPDFVQKTVVTVHTQKITTYRFK